MHVKVVCVKGCEKGTCVIADASVYDHTVGR